MDRHALLEKLASQAHDQDELTARLIEDIQAHGAAIDDLQAIESHLTALQLTRTTLLWEAATIVDVQDRQLSTFPGHIV